MRSTSLAAGIVAVGVLAALPFRRVDAARDPNAAIGLATGPLANQLRQESITGSMQWPQRPGFDPSLAWQPQPMRFETVKPPIEMPPMPDAFAIDSIEVPTPEPLRERFDAVNGMSPSVAEMGSSETTMGPSIELPSSPWLNDDFASTQNPTRPSFTPGSIQSASVIRNEQVVDDVAPERQYIREPN